MWDNVLLLDVPADPTASLSGTVVQRCRLFSATSLLLHVPSHVTLRAVLMDNIPCVYSDASTENVLQSLFGTDGEMDARPAHTSCLAVMLVGQSEQWAKTAGSLWVQCPPTDSEEHTLQIEFNVSTDAVVTIGALDMTGSCALPIIDSSCHSIARFSQQGWEPGPTSPFQRANRFASFFPCVATLTFQARDWSIQLTTGSEYTALCATDKKRNCYPSVQFHPAPGRTTYKWDRCEPPRRPLAEEEEETSGEETIGWVLLHTAFFSVAGLDASSSSSSYLTHANDVPLIVYGPELDTLEPFLRLVPPATLSSGAPPPLSLVYLPTTPQSNFEPRLIVHSTFMVFLGQPLAPAENAFTPAPVVSSLARGHVPVPAALYIHHRTLDRAAELLVLAWFARFVHVLLRNSKSPLGRAAQSEDAWIPVGLCLGLALDASCAQQQYDSQARRVSAVLDEYWERFFTEQLTLGRLAGCFPDAVFSAEAWGLLDHGPLVFPNRMQLQVHAAVVQRTDRHLLSRWAKRAVVYIQAVRRRVDRRVWGLVLDLMCGGGEGEATLVVTTTSFFRLITTLSPANATVFFDHRDQLKWSFMLTSWMTSCTHPVLQVRCRYEKGGKRMHVTVDQRNVPLRMQFRGSLPIYIMEKTVLQVHEKPITSEECTFVFDCHTKIMQGKGGRKPASEENRRCAWKNTAGLESGSILQLVSDRHQRRFWTIEFPVRYVLIDPLKTCGLLETSVVQPEPSCWLELLFCANHHLAGGSGLAPSASSSTAAAAAAAAMSSRGAGSPMTTAGAPPPWTSPQSSPRARPVAASPLSPHFPASSSAAAAAVPEVESALYGKGLCWSERLRTVHESQCWALRNLRAHFAGERALGIGGEEQRGSRDPHEQQWALVRVACVLISLLVDENLPFLMRHETLITLRVFQERFADVIVQRTLLEHFLILMKQKQWRMGLLLGQFLAQQRIRMSLNPTAVLPLEVELLDLSECLFGLLHQTTHQEQKTSSARGDLSRDDVLVGIVSIAEQLFPPSALRRYVAPWQTEDPAVITWRVHGSLVGLQEWRQTRAARRFTNRSTLSADTEETKTKTNRLRKKVHESHVVSSSLFPTPRFPPVPVSRDDWDLNMPLLEQREMEWRSAIQYLAHHHVHVKEADTLVTQWQSSHERCGAETPSLGGVWRYRARVREHVCDTLLSHILLSTRKSTRDVPLPCAVRDLPTRMMLVSYFYLLCQEEEEASPPCTIHHWSGMEHWRADDDARIQSLFLPDGS